MFGKFMSRRENADLRTRLTEAEARVEAVVERERRVVAVLREFDGSEAAAILPRIWPTLCEMVAAQDPTPGPASPRETETAKPKEPHRARHDLTQEALARLDSHVEWLRGDHDHCNPWLADTITVLLARLAESESETLERTARLALDEAARACANVEMGTVWVGGEAALTAHVGFTEAKKAGEKRIRAIDIKDIVGRSRQNPERQ